MQRPQAIKKLFILQSFESNVLRTPEVFFDQDLADKNFKLKVVEKIFSNHFDVFKELGFEDKGIETDVDAIIYYIDGDEELAKQIGIRIEISNSNLIKAHFIDTNDYYSMSICFLSLDCKPYL